MVLLIKRKKNFINAFKPYVSIRPVHFRFKGCQVVFLFSWEKAKTGYFHTEISSYIGQNFGKN